MEFPVESTDRRALWKPLGLPGVVTLREARRAREADLRRARRDSQLRSKRPAWRDSQSDEEQQEHEGSVESPEEQVRARWLAVFKGAKDHVDAVRRLRRALRHPQASSAFCRIDGACRGLVGLLTGLSHPEMQLEAARCFLEMSLSEEPSVALATLSAAPYLITFLGSESSRLTESCLLVLGNLGTEGETNVQTLLKQGLLPALRTCLQSWDPTVVEAAAFCLSQVLQGAESLQSVTQALLKADMLPILLELLRRWSHAPGARQPHLGVPPIMEAAWCLHYILCSGECTEQLLHLGLVQAVGGAFCVLARMILSGMILPGAELGWM
uniref:transmembrane and coiled-coil domain-containing protein 6-like n=1 Tax=Myxine glutinosa TaxID=7769 RepID=UPI00358F0F2D